MSSNSSIDYNEEFQSKPLYNFGPNEVSLSLITSEIFLKNICLDWKYSMKRRNNFYELIEQNDELRLHLYQFKVIVILLIECMFTCFCCHRYRSDWNTIPESIQRFIQTMHSIPFSCISFKSSEAILPDSCDGHPFNNTLITDWVFVCENHRKTWLKSIQTQTYGHISHIWHLF